MPRIGLDLPTLLTAAAEIADREGFEAVTLASLAQKLQIRSPSLYNHIAGLPDLRRHLALRGLATLSAQLEQEVAGCTGDDSIRAFSRTYVAFARTHPGLYEAIQRAPAPDDELLQQAGGRVLDQVYRAMTSYGLEGDAAVHAVRAIRSLLHGFVTLERQGGFGIPLDLDVTFRLMVDTFLAGVKAMRTGEG
ncbi:TetR-like C-terminal domain-containing protein [Cohnella lubricantis]|uniref:WHG domain-containing protein n=1 Tax=Cohnella lubricantis TaxID=2163172 RepID=A0A841TJM0_9BACL|nr:TetR-like C-terminal domain-containing protein [Cohnella lubricantis]MBB6679127.1 WHG domain-containing protein [Cohnella lubricantis]MBP2120180.1 AcrR family transcriptional regulator [Cohnella lubricantis]